MTTPIKTADYILTQHPGIHRDMEKMFNAGYGERYTHIGGTLTLDTSDYEKHGLLKAGHVVLLIIGSIVTLICFIIRECERAPIIAAHQVAEEQHQVVIEQEQLKEQKIQTAYTDLERWRNEEAFLYGTNENHLIEKSYPVRALRYLMENSEALEHKQYCADILWDKTPLLKTKIEEKRQAFADAGPHHNASGCFPNIGDFDLVIFNILIEATLANGAGDLDPNKPSAQLQELNDYDLTMKNWDPETGWVENHTDYTG